MGKTVDWIIHYVSNTTCDKCGNKNQGDFLQYLCDAHTHGLSEKYNHTEFQLVLDFGRISSAVF